MRVVVVLIVCSLLSGCVLFRAPGKIRKKFNYEFRPEDRHVNRIYRNRYGNNPFDTYYIFFDDATFCGIYGAILDNYYKGISIQELLKRACKEEENSFFRFGSWGYYEMKEDTMHLNYLEQRIRWNPNWSASSSTLVLGKNDTLKMISKAYFYPVFYSTQDKLDLIPLDTCYCRTSDSWLKYEKWFWKNKKDYLDWIKRSGGDKRKYKY